MTIASSHELAQELRVALLTRQIHLAVQTKFSLKTEDPIGSEVLLRWLHPKHGLMNAERWISLAENYNLMPQLSQYLITQVIQLIKNQDNNDLPLAINLSPSCLNVELAHFIISHIKEARISPSHIEIEVTETSLPQDPHQLSTALRTLRAQGIKVSLDDFGVGYNSMRYLIDLEVDAIKIDKSFLQKSSQCKVAHMTLKCMIDLAKSIDLEVVCEGIETQEQFFLAKTLGADIGQGFFLGKPQLLFPGTTSNPINSSSLISTHQMVG